MKRKTKQKKLSTHTGKTKVSKSTPKVHAGVWDLSSFSLALFSKFSLCFSNGRKFCVMLLDNVLHRARDTQKQAISEMRKR